MNKRPYELLVFDLQGTLAEAGFFIEGALDLLKILKKQGYLIAAATNWGKGTLKQLLSTLPSDFSFDSTKNASENLSKPDPQMLIQIMEEHHIPPNKTLMIGDTVTDIRFAHHAKVDALAVSYAGTPKTLLEAYKPIACLDSLEALKHWFYL
jgi:phosphoglycolate phosphatase